MIAYIMMHCCTFARAFALAMPAAIDACIGRVPSRRLGRCRPSRSGGLWRRPVPVTLYVNFAVPTAILQAHFVPSVGLCGTQVSRVAALLCGVVLPSCSTGGSWTHLKSRLLLPLLRQCRVNSLEELHCMHMIAYIIMRPQIALWSPFGHLALARCRLHTYVSCSFRLVCAALRCHALLRYFVAWFCLRVRRVGHGLT